jgi:hypothetical protein
VGVKIVPNRRQYELKMKIYFMSGVLDTVRLFSIVYSTLFLGAAKMGFLLRLFAFSGLFCLAQAQVYAGEKIVVTYSQFPPLTESSTGKAEDGPGLLIEFYNKILPDLGYEIEYWPLPSKRIRSLMDAGKEVDLYTCGISTKEQRTQYVFGPALTTVSIHLFQNAEKRVLGSYKDLKSERVLKQHGFHTLEKILDPSNSYVEAHYRSLASMFVQKRADYLIGFKERQLAQLRKKPGGFKWRSYPVKTFNGYLCLNRRFENAEKRVMDIHNAFLAYQETPEGQALFDKYDFVARFGLAK